MAQAAQQYDSDPQQFPSLSPDEKRIANAVVAALRSELQPIKDTQEQHTKILERHSEILQQHSEILERHSKILENIQQEMRGVNRILASEGFIPDNPDL